VIYSQIIKLEGHLFKQGEKGIVKTWKRRWFCVRGTLMYYYRSRLDFKHKGVIDLEIATTIRVNKDEKRKEAFEFQIATPNRIFYLLAPNEHEMWYWVNGLNALRENFTVHTKNKHKLRSGTLDGRSSQSLTESSPVAVELQLRQLREEIEKLKYENKIKDEKILKLTDQMQIKPKFIGADEQIYALQQQLKVTLTDLSHKEAEVKKIMEQSDMSIKLLRQLKDQLAGAVDEIKLKNERINFLKDALRCSEEDLQEYKNVKNRLEIEIQSLKEELDLKQTQLSLLIQKEMNVVTELDALKRKSEDGQHLMHYEKE